MSDSFQLITPDTTALCQENCSSDTLQINCLKSTKLNTQSVTATTINATTACVNKVQLKKFTTLESTGSDAVVVTQPVIATTASDTVRVSLSSSLGLGCITHVIHESGSDFVHVTGLISSDVEIFPRQFYSFIKSTNGWVPNRVSVPP